MSSRLVTFVLAACVVAITTVASAKGDFGWLPQDMLHGDTPPTGATAWFRFTILGPRNAPPPTIWISTRRFRIHVPNKVIVLSVAEYASLKTFVHANPCPAVDAARAARTEGAVELAQHARGHTRVVCTMLRATTCEYLGKLLGPYRLARQMKALEPVSWLRGEACSHGERASPD